MTLRPTDEQIDAAARDWGAGLPPLPASLDDAIMAAVRQRPAPARPRRGLRWLVEPVPMRVRPIWGVGLAAAAALLLWLAPRGATAPTGSPDPVAVAAAPDTVFVHFELTAPAARDVAVAGSFNDWQASALQMTRTPSGTWAVTVPLPVGEHHYQFVVDGARWVPDPTAHAQVDDGFGGSNSVIVVGPRGLVRS